MKRETDIKHEAIATINGYTIIRAEAKEEDTFTGELSGHIKVYYDVCDDIDAIETFKTLREATAFAKQLDIIVKEG